MHRSSRAPIRRCGDPAIPRSGDPAISRGAVAGAPGYRDAAGALPSRTQECARVRRECGGCVSSAKAAVEGASICGAAANGHPARRGRTEAGGEWPLESWPVRANALKALVDGVSRAPAIGTMRPRHFMPGPGPYERSARTGSFSCRHHCTAAELARRPATDPCPSPQEHRHASRRCCRHHRSSGTVRPRRRGRQARAPWSRIRPRPRRPGARRRVRPCLGPRCGGAGRGSRSG